jgi:hypothetical protein
MQTKKNPFGPFLDDAAVTEIVQQNAFETLSMAALDCNWVSGGEKNYFNLWAAVKFYEKKDKVFLHGARFCNWNLEYEMKFVCAVENTGIYRLSLNNPEEFPNEFVMHLKRESGEHIYDNNNYRNFFIEHDKGHFATAIAHNGNVFYFGTIIPIKIITIPN